MPPAGNSYTSAGGNMTPALVEGGRLLITGVLKVTGGWYGGLLEAVSRLPADLGKQVAGAVYRTRAEALKEAATWASKVL